MGWYWEVMLTSVEPMTFVPSPYSTRPSQRPPAERPVQLSVTVGEPPEVTDWEAGVAPKLPAFVGGRTQVLGLTVHV